MTHRTKSAGLLLAWLLVPAALFAAPPALNVEPAPKADAFVPKLVRQKIDGGYAVVVSKTTQADAGWAKVGDALKEKYGDQVKMFTWDKSVDETKPGLSAMMPRYTCFVTRPTEASREFVAQVHRLTRNLNDDPYPDTIWGILTGFDSADALRIAQTSAPLEIHNAVSTTGIHNEFYDSVFTVSDGKDGKIFEKGDASKAITLPATEQTDRAHLVVDAIHDVKPDMLVTSSHGMERILEMPFSKGAFLAINGKVVGLGTSGGHGGLQLDNHGWELSSPNPKVWLASGNCLIGHITDSNSMALAMMHSAGVTQMVGYTVTTWYGAGGWGTLDWFQNQPGRFTLAESFFINDAAMTRRLAHEFPGRERYAVKVYNDENLGSLAEELGEPFPKEEAKQKDLLGLTWDHDTVAFYGDPAWTAKVAPHDSPFDQKLTEDKSGMTLAVVAKTDGVVKAFVFLPKHVHAADYKTTGDAGDALITDTYLLADFGKMKAGEKKGESFTTK